eukprot:TRINITY_DN2022_c0_g1_i1.p2 TRINITY_DN2022_c0_g1~~TRINITY_DN2022_c0_g1_i1.p2  ORF type:complete len:133 (+),score=24.62 TRINITY_DN2022_c0_g1_i1:51-449(+)
MQQPPPRQAQPNAFIGFILLGGFGGALWFLKQLLFGRRRTSAPAAHTIDNTDTHSTTRTFSPPSMPSRSGLGTFVDSIFEGSPSTYDDELKLHPVSVNTYVHLLPTMLNEDGVFVKLLVENTSELATHTDAY